MLNTIPLYKNEIFIRTKRQNICERIWIYVFDTAKKSAADAIKTASKRAIQKTAEATGDLVGNKIADKITSISKKKPDNNNNDNDGVEFTTPKKDTYHQKKDSKLLIN